MICLDTDFIIQFLNGDEKAIKKMNELENSERTIVTTTINILELFIGIVAADGVSSKRIEHTRSFIDSIRSIDLDVGAAEKIAYIYNNLKKNGEMIGLKDTMISGFC